MLSVFKLKNKTLSCEIAGKDGQFLSSLSGLIWWHLSCPHCVCFTHLCFQSTVLYVYFLASGIYMYFLAMELLPELHGFHCCAFFLLSLLSASLLTAAEPCKLSPSKKTSVEEVWKVVLRVRRYLNSQQRNKILQLVSLINMERVVGISCCLYLSIWL